MFYGRMEMVWFVHLSGQLNTYIGVSGLLMKKTEDLFFFEHTKEHI